MSRQRLPWEFLKSPTKVGAVVPSSQGLVSEMVAGSGIESARVLVELGPGSGALTRVIEEIRPPESTFFAVERSPQMAAGLRRRFPQLDLAVASAEHLEQMVAERTPEPVDCVFSNLPWSGFSDTLQDRILRSILAVLNPSGTLTTYAYIHVRLLPSARRFATKLEGLFSSVKRSRVVWPNLPPAFVYRCRQPRVASGPGDGVR